MQYKVVYNKCFGGYSISKKAAERMIELNHPASDKLKEALTYKTLSRDPHVYTDHLNIKRHDPILVQVVEELGSEEASGMCADLAIETVYGSYRIHDYDGREGIVGRDEDPFDWEDPEDL